MAHPPGVAAGDGVVELAVYGAPGELPELAPGEAVVGGVVVSVSATQVRDDWAERWKSFHVPVLVGDRLRVRPPWEDADREDGVIDLVVDPGRAFGTGSHFTTRLCLELLLELAEGGEGGSVCDLGCGSGVLSIAAAKLGFSPVSAFDFDPLAIEATEANAAANAVALAQVERLDLRRAPAPSADLILANLMRPLLLQVAARMDSDPRLLVASGLLDEEAEEVAAAFEHLRERRRISDGGWTALLLAR